MSDAPTAKERVERLRWLLDQVAPELDADWEPNPRERAAYEARLVHLTTEIAEEAHGLAVAFIGPAPAVFWAPPDPTAPVSVGVPTSEPLSVVVTTTP